MPGTATFSRLLDAMDTCPFGAAAGRIPAFTAVAQTRPPPPLYTPEQRRRRNASSWTTVQAILAPLQFAIFLASLALVLRFVFTGQGWEAASLSVVVKTAALYAIMITGAAWERAVFGRWLFAPAFFWEDVFSMLVLLLHTAYVAALFAGSLPAHSLMLLALAAYTAYAINAAQFVLKLRLARLQAPGVLA